MSIISERYNDLELSIAKNLIAHTEMNAEFKEKISEGEQNSFYVYLLKEILDKLRSEQNAKIISAKFTKTKKGLLPIGWRSSLGFPIGGVSSIKYTKFEAKNIKDLIVKEIPTAITRYKQLLSESLSNKIILDGIFNKYNLPGINYTQLKNIKFEKDHHINELPIGSVYRLSTFIHNYDNFIVSDSKRYNTMLLFQNILHPLEMFYRTETELNPISISNGLVSQSVADKTNNPYSDFLVKGMALELLIKNRTNDQVLDDIFNKRIPLLQIGIIMKSIKDATLFMSIPFIGYENSLIQDLFISIDNENNVNYLFL